MYVYVDRHIDRYIDSSLGERNRPSGGLTPPIAPTVGKDPRASTVARGLRRRLCAAAGGPAQTGQPGPLSARLGEHLGSAHPAFLDMVAG